MPREIESLIRLLVRNLEPVQPVRLARMLAACLVVEALVVVGAAVTVGVRYDLSERIGEPSFIAVLVVLALGAAGSAVVALRLALPGRVVSNSTSLLLLSVPIAAAVLVVLVAPWGARWPGLVPLMQGCWHCAGVTTVAATVPWAAAVFSTMRRIWGSITASESSAKDRAVPRSTA